jgi:superfamily II DNA or RNA helicase
MTREEIHDVALKAIEGKDRIGLALATGVGKTLVALKHMDSIPNILVHSILVVAPKKSIIQSWKDEAEKFNMFYLMNVVTFTTYRSLNKMNPRDYDIVYLDECHSLKESHSFFLDAYQSKIVGLTGTPPKNGYSEKAQMVNKFCPMAYEYLVDNAIDDNILNDYKIIVHKLKLGTSKNIEVKTKKQSFFTSELANYNYWSHRIEVNSSNPMMRIMRMKAMMTFPTKEKYAKLLLNSIKSKCIIFTNTKEQAEKLCAHSYHSTNSESEENLNLFRKGDILKLSCVQQLNEGVNIPELKQGIIMHSYGNERQASQKIGRLLRLNPNDTSVVHILCYMDTADEQWVINALEDFDQDKINWVDYNIKLD